MSDDRFSQIVVADFEYEIVAGGLPNPLCMVVVVLDENFRHVRTIRMWRGEFGREPPFDTGSDILFVAYSAWAEMMCFLVLGWRFPVHIYDLHTAFLARTNSLLPYAYDGTKRQKQRKRLSDAAHFYGIEGWQGIDKEDIAKAIGDGVWREKYSPQDVIEYYGRHSQRGAAVAPAAARPALPRRRSRLLLVGLQRQMHRPHTGARHADRRRLVELGAGEQGRSCPRLDPAIRSKPEQPVPDL